MNVRSEYTSWKYMHKGTRSTMAVRTSKSMHAGREITMKCFDFFYFLIVLGNKLRCTRRFAVFVSKKEKQF